MVYRTKGKVNRESWKKTERPNQRVKKRILTLTGKEKEWKGEGEIKVKRATFPSEKIVTVSLRDVSPAKETTCRSR